MESAVLMILFYFFNRIQIENGDLYEVPDGKPVIPIPTAVSGGQIIPNQINSVPDWLRKVEAHHNQPQPVDENVKPQAAVYIENVLLPTRATKVSTFGVPRKN